MGPEPVQQPPLTEQEKLVLELMSGLADGHRHTMAEVAGRLEVSEEQVVAVLRSAKRKLVEPPS
jgi:DNA-directed RNA polymerase sigma subunit (sigma70/sigma32)